MDSLGIGPAFQIRHVSVVIEASHDRHTQYFGVRPGPIVSFIPDESGREVLPEKTRLFGEVIAGGGERFFIRYHELQLPGAKQRIPICAIANMREMVGQGLYKESGSTDEEFQVRSPAYASFVLGFAETF
jgi:hypothetical protein